MYFFLQWIFFAASFSITALANTLSSRAYSTDLKATVSHIDEGWKDLERKINALPKTGGKVEDFRAVAVAMTEFGNYYYEWHGIALENGPFTNTKWSDEYLEDSKIYQARGIAAVQALKTYVPEVNALGDYGILKEVEEGLNKVAYLFHDIEDISGRVLLQFVGGPPLAKPVHQRLLEEIKATSRAYYEAWCHLYYKEYCYWYL